MPSSCGRETVWTAFRMTVWAREIAESKIVSEFTSGESIFGLLQDLRTPRPATGVSRALRGPKCPGECPQECPRKRGVSDGVSDGVSLGPFGPQAPECPKSVPRVSPECLGHLSQTLRGHSRDTFWTLRSPGPEGPQRHPGHSVGHPPFSGTLSGTLPGTLRARRARETPVAGRGVRNARISNWALLGADFWEGDEDSNFSVFRVQRFTEWPGPLH